jgi:asparagine synthase (glutamine-hydrolysing)
MGRIAGVLTESGGGAPFDPSLLLTAIGYPKPAVAKGLAAEHLGQIVALGPLRMVFDGLIYNPEDFSEPDATLVLAGDIGRILSAIARTGLEDVLARLNGDFALALVDDRDGTIRLARDRFGIRSLYHTRVGDTVAFASRPRSLLAMPGVSRKVDPTFLLAASMTHYRFVDTDPVRAPFRDIAQVPAGHIVTFKHGNKGQVRRERYADLKAGPLPSGSPDDQARDYLALLEDSVSRRLRKASNPAFTLSGGLDSSTIATLAGRINGAPPSAISSVHHDETYDERKEIMDIVDAGLVDWHPVQIDDPDLFPLISKLSAFHDQPLPTVTWMSHFLLGQRIADMGYGSVFGGLGGDEQHAGEYDYFFYFFADLKAAGMGDRLKSEIAAWARNHDHPVFRKTPEVAERVMSILVDSQQPGLCRGNADLLYRYQDLLNPDAGNLSDLEPAFEASSSSYLASHMRNELLFNTMPCCLRAADRNAAQLGLQEFHPFLDWRLFEYMLAIPGDRKIVDGVTKAFGRQAYKGLLPEATRTRVVKTGWNAPAHQWFAGPGRDALMDLVTSRSFIERGIYNHATLTRLIEDHQDIVDNPRGRENHMMVLWQIVTFELWLRSIEEIPHTPD